MTDALSATTHREQFLMGRVVIYVNNIAIVVSRLRGSTQLSQQTKTLLDPMRGFMPGDVGVAPQTYFTGDESQRWHPADPGVGGGGAKSTLIDFGQNGDHLHLLKLTRQGIDKYGHVMFPPHDLESIYRDSVCVKLITYIDIRFEKMTVHCLYTTVTFMLY